MPTPPCSAACTSRFRPRGRGAACIPSRLRPPDWQEGRVVRRRRCQHTPHGKIYVWGVDAQTPELADGWRVDGDPTLGLLANCTTHGYSTPQRTTHGGLTRPQQEGAGGALAVCGCGCRRAMGVVVIVIHPTITWGTQGFVMCHSPQVVGDGVEMYTGHSGHALHHRRRDQVGEWPRGQGGGWIPACPRVERIGTRGHPVRRRQPSPPGCGRPGSSASCTVD